jgi:MFS family permease
VWAAVASLAVFSAGAGGLVVLWPITVARDFGVRSFGAISGALGMIAAGLGGATGPIVVGALHDAFQSYWLAFLWGSGALSIGAVLGLATKEPGTPPRRAEKAGLAPSHGVIE